MYHYFTSKNILLGNSLLIVAETTDRHAFYHLDPDRTINSSCSCSQMMGLAALKVNVAHPLPGTSDPDPPPPRSRPDQLLHDAGNPSKKGL